jgi:uncharacterized protein YndB with AHSA1/START domain
MVGMNMTDDAITTTTTVDAPADTVFAVLADPAKHAAIDGTGWVRQSLDGEPLSQSGQVFRMAMYHSNPNYADGNYQVANKVEVFEPPRAIAWLPGQEAPDGSLSFGGWFWRYDLTPVAADQTEVTLTYDWSAVPQDIREQITFPPFDVAHLQNSLSHLASLAGAG